MARALRDHVPEQRTAEQRQIADQIERLVPAAFVGRAQALRDSALPSRVKQTAFSSDAPRISPMFRIWSRSYSQPNVRAKAIPLA